MSKFIDRLKQLTEGVPQPIGFRLGAKPAARLRIQLIGLLTKTKFDLPADSLAEADAVIMTNAEKAAEETLAALSGENQGIPVGVKLPAGMTAGMDFVVFNSTQPISAFPDKKTGKILTLDREMPDGMLRTVNALPVDAVLVDGEINNEAVTYQDLLNIRRLTGAISKPLLLKVEAGISSGDLQACWEAGVDGLVVEIAGDAAETLMKLRKIIDSLEFPDKNRKERLTPTLPRIAPEPPKHEEEEEEDE